MIDRLQQRLHAVRQSGAGVLVSATVAMAAMFLADHYGAPVMLFALLLGMAFAFLHADGGRCVPGIELASTTVLRVGVGLLGARLTVGQIAEFGLTPVLIVIVAVVMTIGFGLLAARLLGQRGQLGLISGGSVAICGASAALAIASVMPRDRRLERDTILVVIAVTTLSTIAMVVYPIATTLLGLDDTTAGYFLGTTIHDVAQVVGAGYSISPDAGDVATFIKLLRVAMLVPVVFVIMLVLSARGGTGERRGGLLPWFLVVFAVLVGVNSAGWIAPAVQSAVSDASRWCLVTAIAALGMKTSLRSLFEVGLRPVVLILAETVFIGGLALALIVLLL